MNESDQKNFNDPDLFDDEIDIRELFNVIWKGKALVILITSIVAIGAVVGSLMLTNYYQSESILAARQSQDTGVLSQYSGLASLAGVSVPNAGGDEVVQVIEIIRSREFLKHLLTFEDVLPSIMAAKTYDLTSQKLYFDPNKYDAKTKKWTSKPSYLAAHKKYRDKLLSISQSKKTGLVSITIEHISPIFAKEFLALIIKEANTLKREKDIATSTEALKYLKGELSQTSFVETKISINQLIKAQLDTRMMAKINEEYSLVIIEPPFVPELKSKPYRAFICLLTTFIGGLLSVMIVLVRYYLFGKETTNNNI